jgi:hypothetical protein
LSAVCPQPLLAAAVAAPRAVRDSRRAHLPGGSIKLERGKYDVATKEEALETAEAPPTPNKPAKWAPLRSILDNDNNGYTI